MQYSLAAAARRSWRCTVRLVVLPPDLRWIASTPSRVQTSTTSSDSGVQPAALAASLQVDRGAVLVAALAVAIALLEVALDLGTPLELDLASMYPLPLLLAAYTRRRALLWALSLLLAIATLLVYELHAASTISILKDEILYNRLLDVVALLVTTAVLHVWLRSLDVRESQSRLLGEQNRRLETAHRLLLDHEAQIRRQNEELKLRHQDVLASNARTSRMLVAVSHDIRTPVQAIGLLAEMMRRTGEDPALASRVPQMAQQLQGNAAAMVSMVSDLLDLARFDSGHMDLKEDTFVLDELVTAKCRELGALAQSKSLSLVAQISSAPIWVRSDPGKVQRVLSNLIGNAIKFTALGGVTVSVGLDGSGSAFVRVSDTGRGIEPEALQRIFDEYAQAGNADGERGWGLGLAISRRLAGALGARIDVESELGNGSTFTLALPPRCVVDIAPLTLAPSIAERPGS
jgi:signal transduction histidine kinase